MTTGALSLESSRDNDLPQDDLTEIVSMTFKMFLEWHPENGQQFELIGGVPQAIPKPVGPHEDICGFLALMLGLTLL